MPGSISTFMHGFGVRVRFRVKDRVSISTFMMDGGVTAQWWMECLVYNGNLSVLHWDF